MPTIRHARTRARVARNTLTRHDPALGERDTWTLYKGPVPRRRSAHTTRGLTATGR